MAHSDIPVPALGETWDRVGRVALRVAQYGGAPGDQFLDDLLTLREAYAAQAAQLAAYETAMATWARAHPDIQHQYCGDCKALWAAIMAGAAGEGRDG